MIGVRGANSIHHRDTESQRIKSIKILHRVRATTWLEIICDPDSFCGARESPQQTQGGSAFAEWKQQVPPLRSE